MAALIIVLVPIVLALAVFSILRERVEKRSAELPTLLEATQEVSKRSEPVDDSSDVVVLSSLLPRQFVVLDLETTGLSPLADEIIEIGAIRVSLDLDSHPTFQTLVKPQRRIPSKITQLTGITQAMVDEQGIELEDALAQFMEFIGDLPIVTFNAAFDMGFIYSAARRHGTAVTNRYTCALKRARRAWPGLPSHRLAYLAEVGKLPTDLPHRALGDCHRALLVFISATQELNTKVRWSKPADEFPVARA